MFNLDDITNNQFLGRSGDGVALATSEDSSILVVLLTGLQLLELFFFHIVVTSCDCNNDADGKENGCTLDPTMGKAIIDDTYDQSDKSSEEQNLEHKILETLDDQTEKSFGFSELVSV